MSDTTEFSVILPDGRRFGPASMDVLQQWAREGRVPKNAQIEAADGLSPARPVMSEPRMMAVLGAPPTVAGEMAAPDNSGAPALIPYNNGCALAAYYVGVGSLIPGLAMVAGPLAIGLGVAGIRKYRREPKVKGVAHAWAGIVLGSLTFLAHIALIIAIVVSTMK